MSVSYLDMTKNSIPGCLDWIASSSALASDNMIVPRDKATNDPRKCSVRAVRKKVYANMAHHRHQSQRPKNPKDFFLPVPSYQPHRFEPPSVQYKRAGPQQRRILAHYPPTLSLGLSVLSEAGVSFTPSFLRGCP